MMYQMDELELATGRLSGFDPIAPPPATDVSPRTALENSLRECLSRQPCMIAFSGGRDSSALLAVAVHVARRDGLPLPTALTLRYLNAPRTEESRWQRLVLDHLGVGDHHHVLTIGDDHDVIGPVAAPLLRRHGVIWPGTFPVTWSMLNVARGGVLVTGTGGDEILGTRRITPVRNVLRSVRSGERPRGCRAALRAVSPQPVRRHLALRDVWRPEWLREPVASTVARRRAFDDVAMSPHAGKQTWELAHRRMYRRFVDSTTTLAAELGTEYRSPLLEPIFLSALARELGPWGWRDRTDSMARLFGDVLPRAVLGRTSKALFTQVNFTEHSREFARSWDGTGINDSIIDGELIRAEWLSPLPRFGAMAPLQSAWLAGQPRATGCDGAPVQTLASSAPGPTRQQSSPRGSLQPLTDASSSLSAPLPLPPRVRE